VRHADPDAPQNNVCLPSDPVDTHSVDPDSRPTPSASLPRFDHNFPTWTRCRQVQGNAGATVVQAPVKPRALCLSMRIVVCRTCPRIAGNSGSLLKRTRSREWDPWPGSRICFASRCEMKVCRSLFSKFQYRTAVSGCGVRLGRRRLDQRLAGQARTICLQGWGENVA
jgi:hypothetical protein